MNQQQKIASGLSALAAEVEQEKYGQDDALDLDALQEDIKGECNARLFIGDIHGDGYATMRCQLRPGHIGDHKERYNAGDDDFPNWVTVTWEQDESILCEKHGRQRIVPPDPDYPDAPACEACNDEYWEKEVSDAEEREDS